MEDLLKAVLVFITALLVGLLLSLVGGTIFYFIYPHIHVLFPSAAKNGIIAYSLDWWDAVCVVWIFSLLLKPYSSSKSASGE